MLCRLTATSLAAVGIFSSWIGISQNGHHTLPSFMIAEVIGVLPSALAGERECLSTERGCLGLRKAKTTGDRCQSIYVCKMRLEHILSVCKCQSRGKVRPR